MIHAIIPIKKHSKGLPCKNFMEFAGKKMYQWALDSCLQCENIDKVWVSSSFYKFKEEINATYPEVGWIDRPEELNGNVELRHVIKHASTVIGDKEAVYAQVQANKPLITTALLNKVTEHYLHSTINGIHVKTLFTVQEVNTSIDWEVRECRQEGKKHFKSCAVIKLWDYYNLNDTTLNVPWNRAVNQSEHCDYFIPQHHMEIDTMEDFKIAECLKKGGF